MSSRTWSQWLGIDEQSKAEAKARKEQETKEKQQKAVDELREMFLNTEEGRLCGKQLAQGGEFGRFGAAEELVTDAYLRRWLVARDWQVDVTFKLLLDHGSWRARHTPKGYIDDARVRRPLDDDKTFLQGVDYQGRALVIVRVRNHFSNKRCLQEMKLFSAYIIDALVALCDKSRNPQCRVVCMFDMTGCSMSNMDMPCMTNILALLGNHYVERLSAMYFYNPPRIFWGLWNAGRAIMPEVTRNKIKVIDPSDLEDLRSCVPPNVLPKEYGGEAELLPIHKSRIQFKLPPHDGREYSEGDKAEAAATAAADAADAAAGEQLLSTEVAEASQAGSLAAGSSQGDAEEPVDARLVLADGDGAADGGKASVATAEAGAEVAVRA